MFFCGLLAVFEQLGAYKASEILFRPLLRPLLGIPGKCGIAFISSFTGLRRGRGYDPRPL